MSPKNPGAYVRRVHIAQTTQTVVHVVDLCHPAAEHEPGVIVEQRDLNGTPVKQRTLRWGTVCVEHDICCPHERRDDAYVSADDPTDWCDGCKTAAARTLPFHRDGDALPLLHDLMREAGHHDAPACSRLVDEVEALLPAKGPHKSKADLVLAREGIAAENWVQVHSAAWGAMCGLTWAFPPDPMTCAPVPEAVPFPRGPKTCRCGAEVRRTANFCHACGRRSA